MATRRIKHQYLQTFGITVLILALVRCVFPGIAEKDAPQAQGDTLTTETAVVEEKTKSAVVEEKAMPAVVEEKAEPTDIVAKADAHVHTAFLKDGDRPHPILSVPGYAKTFPDSNHVQIKAAQQWGVSPVKNRADAEERKDEVVFMGFSPYYAVAHLDASIPYLVPRAAILLQDIGRTFLDSLQVKGLPLHLMVVSSVLRTEQDVARLRQRNKNATEQSCHLYGTTFDINYNVYKPVNPAREIPGDKLKFVLSEVLRDLREEGRCYVKYEVLEPCFHITVR